MTGAALDLSFIQQDCRSQLVIILFRYLTTVPKWVINRYTVFFLALHSHYSARGEGEFPNPTIWHRWRADGE
jgi:hypothetical protein